MPPGLEYPRGTEIWAPLTAWGVAEGSYDVASNELDIVARLGDGATHAQARSELSTFFSTLPAPGWRREARAVVHGFRAIVLGDAQPAMRVVLLAAALLLVIACINVANLQLVRSLGRVRELMVRSALGASHGRIVRHELRESVLLAVIGGAAGVIVGAMLVRLFVVVAPPGLPRVADVALNGKVLVAALAISAFTVVASGLAPALLALRVDPGDVLRSGVRHTGSRRVRLIGEFLVATQVALAVVALSSAALVGRSLANLYRVDMAFDPGRLVVAELAIRQDRFPGRDAQAALVNRLVSRLEAMTGVEGMTPVLNVPFIAGGGGIDGRMSVPGQDAEERARNPVVNMEVASPGYFGVLGIPLLQGRAFSENDVTEHQGGDREPHDGARVLARPRSHWPATWRRGRIHGGGRCPGHALSRPRIGAPERLLPVAAAVLSDDTDDARYAGHSRHGREAASPGGRRGG
jgi:putative ABC transport system permease protein